GIQYKEIAGRAAVGSRSQRLSKAPHLLLFFWTCGVICDSSLWVNETVIKGFAIAAWLNHRTQSKYRMTAATGKSATVSSLPIARLPIPLAQISPPTSAGRRRRRRSFRNLAERQPPCRETSATRCRIFDRCWY